jgi:hypothetical protein
MAVPFRTLASLRGEDARWGRIPPVEVIRRVGIPFSAVSSHAMDELVFDSAGSQGKRVFNARLFWHISDSLRTAPSSMVSTLPHVLTGSQR